MSSDQSLADILDELREQGERLKAIEQATQLANELRDRHGMTAELHLAGINSCLDTLIHHLLSEEHLDNEGYAMKRQWYEDQLMVLRDQLADLRSFWRSVRSDDSLPVSLDKIVVKD